MEHQKEQSQTEHNKANLKLGTKSTFQGSAQNPRPAGSTLLGRAFHETWSSPSVALGNNRPLQGSFKIII